MLTVRGLLAGWQEIESKADSMAHAHCIVAAFCHGNYDQVDIIQDKAVIARWKWNQEWRRVCPVTV